MTLTGERIYVRPMTEADATETYASWLNDPEVNKYLATKSATVEELKKYIAEKNIKPDTELYGIFLKENDLHIGTTKLEPIDSEKKSATLGIMIGDKKYWGSGAGVEAMKLLISRCFGDLGLREVVVGVLAQNASAFKTYLSMGFVETRRKAGAVHYPNGIFDQVTMVLHNSSI